MRNTFAIARKELDIYFTTVIAYSGFGTLAFILGMVFIYTLNRFQESTQYYLAHQQPQMLEHLNFNDAIIGPVLSTVVWLFLFFVPFLTMRLLAEEKQNRTFELLMTAPVTSLEIVLGKFIAAGVMIGVMTAIALVFPLILSMYGTGTASASGVEWAPVWSGLLSLLSIGLLFASIGLLVSSMTESQIVAALLTFAMLLMGFVIPMIASRLEGDWRTILEYISPVAHLNRGIEGRIAVQDLVYFGSATIACVFLTLRSVESNRWR
jgi:gliding motility-associated transport system permease protein